MICCGVISIFMGNPTDNPSAAVIMAVILYVPIALFLPASFLVDKRLLAWLSFLLMFYFCGFVLQATNPPPSLYWGITNSVLCFAYLTLLILAIRSRPSLSGSKSAEDAENTMEKDTQSSND